MKLTNIKNIGRFRNKETGRAVNIKKGRDAARGVDVYFYLYRGRRVFIGNANFYSNFELVND
jgi:hypothetical protein